jgi:hypothetical protein
MTEARWEGVTQSVTVCRLHSFFGSYLLTISTSTDFAEHPGTATSSAAAANDFDTMVNVYRFTLRSTF